MTTLSLRNRISIAEICFYAPTLLLALFLAARHGPGRNAAWLFLIIFSCIRLVGAALQLETIQQPLSIPINTAAMILQNVGISPLMLVTLALLGRMLGAIRQTTGGRRIVLKPFMLRIIQLTVVLGLVLGIVGGVKAGNEFSRTWKFQMQVEGKAGLALICAGYGLLVAAAGTLSCYARHIAEGEKRLLLAVFLSLPFVLVRILYGCMATFTTDERFNQLLGDVNYFLGMAVVMEMMVVVFCAGLGATTKPMPFREQVVTLREIREGFRETIVGHSTKQSSREPKEGAIDSQGSS